MVHTTLVNLVRTPLHRASGGAPVRENWQKIIRFAKYGCSNRPFFHIVVMHVKDAQKDPPIDQVGSVDPLANSRNEKLVALNYERIIYWLGQGAEISEPVRKLLGLAGLFPVHPRTYMQTWRRKKLHIIDKFSEMPKEKVETAQN